ncbi:MAG: dihydrolipoyl dehydrogenase [Desulfobacterales bacterium]|nr:dihydrolipoyl dehydrogenase [Desulfobacterales bacterium]MDJ0884326.1 dihydrolipoyl dehydrogenase [Desulfobacterales bacterium]
MASSESYDLIIIGSGPGGYVAAVKAAQLGMKTACVEKAERLGGVCLNVGCIPSKALLDSSEFYHLAKHRFAEHGIKTGRVSLDLSAMMARKDKVVADLTANVKQLLEGNGVAVVPGQGRLKSATEVEVLQGKKKQTFSTRHILLATGSTPVSVPGLDFDGERIVSSTGALEFDRVPKQLGIVGGGYIGLELGSVWMRLGAKVTVIEMLPRVAGLLDGQVGRTLDRILRKQGMDIRVKTRVLGAKATAKKVSVTVEHQDQEETLNFDRLLVCVGRRPLTDGLNLDGVGVQTEERSGLVKVDAGYRTSVPSIYAIGDLVPGPALAHKASAEGIAAVEAMAGQPAEVNYDAIPAIIYTAPEVASVGLTEEEIKQRGIPYCTGSYPFSGAGRARCMGETDGFVKLLSHQRTDRILGVHIIGARAADMIAECVLAVEFGASAEDLARTIHGHPTFSEALMEAAMGARQCSIYAS